MVAATDCRPSRGPTSLISTSFFSFAGMESPK
jgi:hypothetical protein